MDIGIIGAGVTGLTAAYDLALRGHEVTIYESRSYAGGLAAGFSDERWEWPLDRFYHHWFASDSHIIRLIDELGARGRLFFPRPTTTLYHRGRLFPVDSPVRSLRHVPFASLHRAIRMLQFTPLPLIDRLRNGLMGVYLILARDWRKLERVTADEWLRKAVGDRAYELFWKPLLISKFGEDSFQEVNMAWMWARLHKRTASLGYFVGGFQGFVDLLLEQVLQRGAKIRLDTCVRSIHREGEQIRIEWETGCEWHDQVIATCSPHVLRDCTPELPGEYAARLGSLRSMGALALILALKHPLTLDHYWINLPKGEGIPFMGLVEHTNYISPERYGGDHLVFCGDYLPPDHAYFDYSKEELLETYLPGLVRINPHFRPDWIRKSWLFTEAYAQPIPPVNHSHSIPPLKTPIPGLWMANMSQVYPWDRGTNYAVEMAHRVVQEMTT